jgi:23S rRNA (cytidine1920-2'-O)/16S rRNA (cytidine1409-2'-O)-methyltransferase
VLPAVLQAARAHLCAGSAIEAVVLVKPQFEVGRAQVGKGGIVRDPVAQQAAVEQVRAAVAGLGGKEMTVIESPILGSEGNREFLLHARFEGVA